MVALAGATQEKVSTISLFDHFLCSKNLSSGKTFSDVGHLEAMPHLATSLIRTFLVVFPNRPNKVGAKKIILIAVFFLRRQHCCILLSPDEDMY